MRKSDKEITLIQFGIYCSKHDCEKNCLIGKLAHKMNQPCPAFLKDPEAARIVSQYLKHRRVYKEYANG